MTSGKIWLVVAAAGPPATARHPFCQNVGRDLVAGAGDYPTGKSSGLALDVPPGLDPSSGRKGPKGKTIALISYNYHTIPAVFLNDGMGVIHLRENYALGREDFV